MCPMLEQVLETQVLSSEQFEEIQTSVDSGRSVLDSGWSDIVKMPFYLNRQVSDCNGSHRLGFEKASAWYFTQTLVDSGQCWLDSSQSD